MNPFSTRFVQPGAIPYRFPTPDGLAALVRRLRGAGGWGEITGPHGSGKSTLLASLLPELAGWRVRHVRLDTSHRTLPADVFAGSGAVPAAVSGAAGTAPLPGTRLLVIDGFEQLGFLMRWRVKRHCRRHGCGLLVTAHRPMGLPVLCRTDVDPPAARELIARLVPAGGEWVLEGFDVAACLWRHRGSLRDVLFELYDSWDRGTPGG